MDDLSKAVVGAKELGALLGTSGGKVLEWFHQGIIPAEVAEGRVFRFDVENVKLVLKHRAAKRAEAEIRPLRPASYFPSRQMPKPTPLPLPPPEPAPPKGVYMAEYRARKAKEKEARRIERERQQSK